MSQNIAKKLKDLQSHVGDMTKSVQVPESKQKKIERDADLKKKADAAATANAKVISQHNNGYFNSVSYLNLNCYYCISNCRLKLNSQRKSMNEPRNTKKNMKRLVD